MFRFTVGDMKIGDSGYITEWSVDNEALKIDASARVENNRAGTLKLYVKKVGENKYQVINEYGKIYTTELSDKEKLDIAIEALENIVNMEKFYYNPYLYGLDTARKALKKLT